MQRKMQKPDILAAYVKREIEEMIVSQGLKPGDCLGPEIPLAERLGVSRVTLREALRLLENDGVVVKRNGVGTFVATPEHFISGRLEVDFSLSDAASAAGMTLSTVVAKAQEREPLSREKTKLQLKEGEKVFCFERMRYYEGKCIVLSFDTIPSRILKEKEIEKLANRSLYSLLEKECGYQIVMGEAVLSATFATQEFAQVMGVNLGSPLMLIEQTDFDPQGAPVLFSREYYNSRIFKFKISRQRNLEQHALEYFTSENKEG